MEVVDGTPSTPDSLNPLSLSRKYQVCQLGISGKGARNTCWLLAGFLRLLPVGVAVSFEDNQFGGKVS
jgi:hypothetical protein